MPGAYLMAIISTYSSKLIARQLSFLERETEKWIFWICLQSWSNILVCEKICKFLLLRVFCVDFRQNYYKYFHMGIWWSRWHVYVTEQVSLINSLHEVSNFIRNINTMLCPIICNSDTIELTVHTTCYWGLRLTLCWYR